MFIYIHLHHCKSPEDAFIFVCPLVSLILLIPLNTYIGRKSVKDPHQLHTYILNSLNYNRFLRWELKELQFSLYCLQTGKLFRLWNSQQLRKLVISWFLPKHKNSRPGCKHFYIVCLFSWLLKKTMLNIMVNPGSSLGIETSVLHRRIWMP